MSFQQVGKIGRPGKPGKWKQPAGTQLWRFTLRTNTGVFLTRRTIFDPSTSESLFELQNSYSGYNAQNFAVLIDEFTARRASTGWSATPANHHIEQSFNADEMLPAGALEKETAIIESTEGCGNPEIASAVWPYSRLFVHDGTSTSPDLRINNVTRDNPTVSTICVNDFDLSIRILIPVAPIIRGANGYTGTGTATLLSEA